jgi:predicted AAA+ superfamily ATPase
LEYNQKNFRSILLKFERTLKKLVIEALSTFPAIFIAGARRVGKTTLSMEIVDNYLTFDDINIYLSAKNDPVSFIKNLQTPVILDEIQKVPELFDTLKNRIDKENKSGQFILTGSVNIRRFQKIKESLAGRLALFELYPLSIFEVNNRNENLIENLFSGNFLNGNKFTSFDFILDFILKGGYPEAYKINSDKLRYIWFASYISTYIEKDIFEIGEIRNIDKFLNLFHLLASYSGNLIKKSNISNASNIDIKTLENYLSILQLIYQIKILRPFSLNIGKKFTKTPKLYFNDTGILCYLLGITNKKELINSIYFGNIVETFVFNEFLKHSAYSFYPTEIFFYRTNDKKEIDFIIKTKNEYIAIEVKTSSTISRKDISTMKEIKNLIKYGIVLYNGDEILPFGENIFAVPYGVLF